MIGCHRGGGNGAKQERGWHLRDHENMVDDRSHHEQALGLVRFGKASSAVRKYLAGGL